MPLAVVIEVLGGCGLAGRDKAGLSDPFCTIRFKKNKYRTKTHPQTVNPVWNECIKLGLFTEEDDVEVTCWDRDRMSSNDVLGYFSIPLKEFALPFMVGEHKKSYTLQSRPGHKDVGVKGSIEVKIIIKDKNSKKDKEKKSKSKSNRSKRATTSLTASGSPAASPALAGGSPEGELEDKANVKKRLTSFFKFRPASREEFEDKLSGSGLIPRGPKSTKVFGATLDEVMARQKLSHPEMKIPLFVHLVLEKLANNPLTFSEQGLFRISGSAITAQKVRSQVDSGKVPDLTGCTRDDLASLLKEYIRELPEPLFTSALYRQWVDVYDVPEEKVVPTLRALVRKLPLHNRYLWEEVNKFLFRLSKHSDVNMMAPQNIGIVIGPNVLWQPPFNMPVMEMNDVVCRLVENCEQIWAPGPEDEQLLQRTASATRIAHSLSVDMGSSGAGVPQFINPTTNPLRVGSTIGVQVPLSPSALDRRRLTAPPGVIQRELLAQQEAAAMTAAPEESQQLPADPAQWSVNDVAEWLSMKGFSQYAPTFKGHSINGDALLGLTAEKLLTEFEVKSLGHRKKILFRIRDLKRA